MTTMAQAPERRSAAHSNQSGPNFMRALNSEWIKFRSVPSTPILLATTFVVMVGVAALLSWATLSQINFIQQNPQEAAQFGSSMEAVRSMILGLPVSGVLFGVLVFLALGVVFIASEMSTGAIRSTTLAIPTRWQSIVAKAVIVAIAGFIITVLAGLSSYLVAQPILGVEGEGFSLADDGVFSAILWAGLYVAISGILAVAVGTLLKNSAGGIVTLVGLWFVVPIITSFVQSVQWVQDASRFLPMNLGNSMTAIGDAAEGQLTQLQSALAMGVWALIPLILAVVVHKARDIK